ncbi:btb/poz and math domain-containing protein 2 [Fagus crenata]
MDYASEALVDTLPKRCSVAGILECILKEFNVFVFEKRYSVARVLPSFPIMFIIYASCTLGTIFMILPHEQVDGTPVPIVVFKDRPTAFHAFLISIMLSFTGAFSAMLIQHRPRVERFCRVYAMASMVSAISILLYTTALWGFRNPHLTEQKIKIGMKKFTLH